MREGRRAYIFCLVLLWTVITFTAVLDWMRNLELLDKEEISVTDNLAFLPASWNTVDDILSTLVIIIADGLLVSKWSNSPSHN